MDKQKGIAAVLITVIIVLVAILAVGGYVIYQKLAAVKSQPIQGVCTEEAKLCPDGSSVGRTGPNCEFAQCPVPQTITWKVYANTTLGFEFKYPEKFDTSFATFQQPPDTLVNKAGSDTIDKDGCYISQDGTNGTSASKEVVVVNDLRFCLSQSVDVGAGQLYSSYYYTTFKDGNYITLQFVVHTSNGCGAYGGLIQQQPCEDFMKNYGSIVLKPIKDSVSTFKFTPK